MTEELEVLRIVVVRLVNRRSIGVDAKSSLETALDALLERLGINDAISRLGRCHESCLRSELAVGSAADDGGAAGRFVTPFCNFTFNCQYF